MPLRCVYTDLDGTLLGAGASLFRDGEGEFSLLPARALEACHRAGVEVVCMSGRRRAQVAEDARLMGQASFIFEIGAGVAIDGEDHLLVGDFGPRDGHTPHELIAESGAPALLLDTYGDSFAELHPFHRDRYVTHLFHGLVDVDEANALLEREGHTGLRLLDNGGGSPGETVYHLVPRGTSKLGAVELHMRVRGYAREECVAVGDSGEDMAVAPAVGTFFLVANARVEPAASNVVRTEDGHGHGFYEAVVSSLVT